MSSKFALDQNVPPARAAPLALEVQVEELEWSVVTHVHRFPDGSVHWYVSFSDGGRHELYDESMTAKHMSDAVRQVAQATIDAYGVLIRQRALGAWQKDRR